MFLIVSRCCCYRRSCRSSLRPWLEERPTSILSWTLGRVEEGWAASMAHNFIKWESYYDYERLCIVVHCLYCLYCLVCIVMYCDSFWCTNPEAPVGYGCPWWCIIQRHTVTKHSWNTEWTLMIHGISLRIYRYLLHMCRLHIGIHTRSWVIVSQYNSAVHLKLIQCRMLCTCWELTSHKPQDNTVRHVKEALQAFGNGWKMGRVHQPSLSAWHGKWQFSRESLPNFAAETSGGWFLGLFKSLTQISTVTSRLTW